MKAPRHSVITKNQDIICVTVAHLLMKNIETLYGVTYSCVMVCDRTLNVCLFLIHLVCFILAPVSWFNCCC